jgi:hypothetical protein
MPDDADEVTSDQATIAEITSAPADGPETLPALADERRELVELETEVAAIEAELGALDPTR